MRARRRRTTTPTWSDRSDRWRPSAPFRSCRPRCSRRWRPAAPFRPFSVTPRMIPSMVRAAPADITRRSGADRRRVDASRPAATTRATIRGCAVDAAARDGADRPRSSAAASPRSPARTRCWRTRCRPTCRPAARRRRARPAGRFPSGCPNPNRASASAKRVAPEAARDLGGADVARELEHLGDGQHAVRVRVVDRVLADHHPAHQAVEAVVRLHHAGVERRGDGERLHGRAGLVGVGDGAVARASASAAPIGSFGL